jgi:GNAT superfamily N-acetyltransferase
MDTPRSGSRTAAPAFKVRLLSPEAAGDRALISALANLVNEVYASAEEGLWAEGATRTSAAEMAEFTKAGEVAIAYRDDRLLGCIRIRKLDDGASEFGMLAAAHSHRGIGIGRELVRFAEQRARDSRCGTMQLELLVPHEWKHPSKEFLDQWYSRIGYDVVGAGSVAEYYPDLFPLLATPCGFRIYRKNIGISGPSKTDLLRSPGCRRAAGGVATTLR